MGSQSFPFLPFFATIPAQHDRQRPDFSRKNLSFVRRSAPLSRSKMRCDAMVWVQEQETSKSL